MPFILIDIYGLIFSEQYIQIRQADPPLSIIMVLEEPGVSADSPGNANLEAIYKVK